MPCRQPGPSKMPKGLKKDLSFREKYKDLFLKHNSGWPEAISGRPEGFSSYLEHNFFYLEHNFRYLEVSSGRLEASSGYVEHNFFWMECNFWDLMFKLKK